MTKCLGCTGKEDGMRNRQCFFDTKSTMFFDKKLFNITFIEKCSLSTVVGTFSLSTEFNDIFRILVFDPIQETSKQKPEQASAEQIWTGASQRGQRRL